MKDSPTFRLKHSIIHTDMNGVEEAVQSGAILTHQVPYIRYSS